MDLTLVLLRNSQKAPIPVAHLAYTCKAVSASIPFYAAICGSADIPGCIVSMMNCWEVPIAVKYPVLVYSVG